MNKQISSDQLYRNVSSKPMMWNMSEERPTSAVFKDSKGVSVDRLLDRTEPEAISMVLSHFDDSYAIVKVSVEKCIEIGAVVLEKPIAANIYHAEIHRSLTAIELTSSQARQLAKAAEVVHKGIAPYK